MTETETEIIVETDEPEQTVSPGIQGIREQSSEARNSLGSEINITKKPVKDLTKEEKDFIINNAKNGVENEFFNVKFFKNGSARVTAKKEKTPTVSQKVIKNNSDGKVYLSNDQLLMEHIIELNSRLDKLTGKHKKLKKKYHRLRNDIYEDVDASEEVVEPTAKQDEVPQQAEPITKQVSLEARTSLGSEEVPISLPRIAQRGWRSRVTYL